MSCKEIEGALSAYLEDDFPSREKMPIEEHLASCLTCRKALEDLKKARELVQDLEEVEPPPWLKLRIMSRVREEEEKKESAVAKFFRSLYVKVPVASLATLLIAVLAVYVYRAGEPETKRVIPLYKPPVEVRQERPAVAAREVPPAPPAHTLKKRPVTGKGVPTEGGRSAAPAAAVSGEGLREEVKKIPEMSAFDAAKSSLPSMAEGDKDARKTGEDFTYVGAVPRKEKAAAMIPSTRHQLAAAGGKETPIEVAIHVRNAEAAVKEVEAIMRKLNARLIDKKGDGTEVLKIEMDARNVKEFFDELGKVGDIEKGTAAANVIAPGIVTIRMEIWSNH